MDNNNIEQLKDNIREYIKQNGNKEITGQILQDVLLGMVDGLVGNDAVANPEGEAAEILEKIGIAGINYTAPQGPQGVSPTVQVTQTENGYHVVITDKDGPHAFDLTNGPANTLIIGTVTDGEQASASITGEAPNQQLNLVLPKGEQGDPGQNAVNPFKGWYNSLAELKAAHTAIEGDSAYVKDASPATTWSIYVYDATATANNNWVDSGLDADTSNAQTFASGEEVNETHIDVTGLVSPILGSLAKAEDAMLLKSTLQCSTLEETKAEFVLGNGYIDHNGAVSGSITKAHAEIVIPSGYDSIRFLGLMTYTGASTINYCIAFYNSNDVAIKTIRYLIKPASPAVKNEYIVAIPEGATKFKCSMAAANRNTFYCYFRKGKSVGDNIDGVVDEVHQEIYDLAQVTDVVVNPDVPADTNYKSIQNAAIGGNITSYYVDSSTQKIMRYDVEGGRQYFLSGYWRISYGYTVASWTDENGVILKVEPFNGDDAASLALTLDNYKLTAPEGARYLYILNRTSTYLTNPILKEWRVKDFSTRRKVGVLCVGNSYSQDALAYLPFLWSKVVSDIDLTVGILYADGASLSDHWNNWQNNADAYTLFVSENGKAWTSRSSSSIKYALDNFGWDIILTHQKSSDSYYPSNAYESNHQPYLNNLINAIQAYVSRPLKFGWMLIQARPAQASGNNYTETQLATNFANIVANAQKVIGQTLCEFVIPWGTAIQNARTLQDICVLGNYVNNTNNNSGKGYLTYDGVHLQEGLPCQVAAYTVLLSLLGLVGEDCRSIVGDDTVTDTSWLAGKNIPGPNPSAGTPVGATLENARKAQKCAVMARKSPYEVTDMSYIVSPK